MVNGAIVEMTLEEEQTTREEWAENLNKYNDELPRELVYKKRLKAYGSLADQLDFIVNNGIEEFIARNQAIKEQHPLPIKVVK